MDEKESISNQKPVREDLTGEHRLGDAGQIILAILFFSIWIIDTFFLHFSTINSPILPWFFRIPSGFVLIFYGYYLARTGLKIVFGEVREKPGVIRERVFGIVRHPVYLSELLVYLGLLILRFSLIAFLVWIAAVGFMVFISRYEEKLLIQRFGKEYINYMKEVPMLIPRLFQKRGRE
jgi:protein-S-isoprenylcysteine O-methyltransferase Ste14